MTALWLCTLSLCATGPGPALLVVVDDVSLGSIAAGGQPELARLIDVSACAAVHCRTRSDWYSGGRIDHSTEQIHYIDTRACLIAAATGRRLLHGTSWRERVGYDDLGGRDLYLYSGLDPGEPYGRLADELTRAGWDVAACSFFDDEPGDYGLDPGLVALTDNRTADFIARERLEAELAAAVSTPWYGTGRAFRVVGLPPSDLDPLLRLARRAVDASGGTLFVLTMPPRGSVWATERLALFLRYDGRPGLLESPTTRRLGVIRITDVCPAVLAALGVEPSTDMEGRAPVLREPRREGNLAYLRTLQARVLRSGEGRTAVFDLLVGASLVVAIAAVVFWWFGPDSWCRGLIRALALALAIAPAPILIFSSVLTPADPWHVVRWALAMALMIAAALVQFVPEMACIVAALAVVPLTVVVDQLLGGDLATFSFLGYCLSQDSRLYGVGNTLSIMTIVSTLLLAGTLSRGRARRWAWALTFVPVVAIGAPMLGANTGGLLTAGFATTLAIGLALRNRRLLPLFLLAAPVIGALAVLAAGMLDIKTHHDPTTHLGIALKDVLGGNWEWLGRTLKGKVDLVKDRFSNRLWWVPTGAAGLLLPWVWADGDHSEHGPPIAYILAGGITSVFAGLVNDSGLVMTAMGCLPCIAAAAYIHQRPVSGTNRHPG